MTICSDKFWEFSVNFYSNEEVKKLCLDFQDNFQQNVNFLIFIVFLYRNVRVTKASQLLLLKTKITPLNRQIIVFRNHRKSLKLKDNKSYQLALRDELSMEKDIQSQLVTQYLNSVTAQTNNMNEEKERLFDSPSAALHYVFSTLENSKPANSEALNQKIDRFVALSLEVN